MADDDPIASDRWWLRHVSVIPVDGEQGLGQEILTLMNDRGDSGCTTAEFATILKTPVPLLKRTLRRLRSEDKISRWGPTLWGPARSSPPPAVGGQRDASPLADRILSLMSRGEDRSWNERGVGLALDVPSGSAGARLSKLNGEHRIRRLGGGWYARVGSSQPTQERLRNAIVEVVSNAGDDRSLTALEIERAVRLKLPQVAPERVAQALRIKDGRLLRRQTIGEAARFTLASSG